MLRSLLAALSLLVAVPSAAAQEGQGASDRIVNDPRVPALTAYGLNLPPQIRADKGVQFGKAMRIQLPGHAEFWRIGVITPTLKPVKKGDRIVIAFWARAEKTEGGVPAVIRRVQLEATTPGIRTIFEKAFEIGPEWQMHQLSGLADQDYPPGQLNAALHLNGAKQVLDIGPVFILNYGAAR